MYNLEVANDHTFVVGQRQWVVYNCGGFTGENFDTIAVNGFKELSRQATHFADHGAEVGATSLEEYGKMAGEFLSGDPQEKGVMQMLTKSNTGITSYARYNPLTKNFGMVTKDEGTILSFFNLSNRSNPFGYFLRQYRP